MATDLLGRTIATGARYALAGIVREINGTDVTVVVGENEPVHASAEDLVQVADLLPHTLMSVAANNLGAGVTALNLLQDGNFFVQGGGSIGTLGHRTAEIVGMSADISHNHGSDPGAWTLTAQVYDDQGVLQLSDTLSCSMANWGFAKHNFSYVELSTPLLMTVGVHGLAATLTGPATNALLAAVHFVGRWKP